MTHAFFFLLVWGGLVPVSGEPEGRLFDPAPYREHLKTILARPEFRAALRESGIALDLHGHPFRSRRYIEAIGSPVRRAWKWLKETAGDVLDRLGRWFRWRSAPRPRQANPAGLDWYQLTRPAVWVAAVIAFWLLLFVLYRTLVGASPSRSPAGQPATEGSDLMPDALTRTVDEWRVAAAACVQRGEWRSAIRALYLSSLNLLHRRGLIHYQRERTNGEYLAMLVGQPTAESFTALTDLFERAWYGAKPLDQPACEFALRLTSQLDELSMRKEAAG
jgi:hypothetical protein